jgi:hypothetical protein
MEEVALDIIALLPLRSWEEMEEACSLPIHQY